jgi:hypothetical protein
MLHSHLTTNHSIFCSLLTSAHFFRLSAFNNATRIFALDDGLLCEQGTHTELMQLKGLYHSLKVQEGQNRGAGGNGEGRLDADDADGGELVEGVKGKGKGKNKGKGKGKGDGKGRDKGWGKGGRKDGGGSGSGGSGGSNSGSSGRSGNGVNVGDSNSGGLSPVQLYRSTSASADPDFERRNGRRLGNQQRQRPCCAQTGAVVDAFEMYEDGTYTEEEETLSHVLHELSLIQSRLVQSVKIIKTGGGAPGGSDGGVGEEVGVAPGGAPAFSRPFSAAGIAERPEAFMACEAIDRLADRLRRLHGRSRSGSEEGGILGYRDSLGL